MAVFKVPGEADALDARLVERWNELVHTEFQSQAKGRFFVLDPKQIPGGQKTDRVRWSCAPAEPENCFGVPTARMLSDWDWQGRQELHNEYSEYAVIYRFDQAGQRRPKRVEVTTELREYWVMLARQDPELVLKIARDVLGEPVSMEDLYGPDVGDPTRLAAIERERRFNFYTAGSGGNRQPRQPQGRLNRERALFMTHPINGLDDLIYIVAFGAIPWAVGDVDNFRQATLEELFITQEVEHLFCRHADPAAADGAYQQSFNGRQLAFADPLGVYIQSFAQDRFFLVKSDEAVPDAWVRFQRGRQRLVFGPPDEDPRFLDDIGFEVGGDTFQLSGGFDIVAAMEVGPNLVVGSPSALKPDDVRPFLLKVPPQRAIRCGESARCQQLAQFKARYEREHGSGNGPQEPRG